MTKDQLRILEKERSDKNYARSAVRNAIKNGKLKKEPCFCGEIKVEAHHSDYTKPLDVIWVCKKHHVELDHIKKNQDIRDKTGLVLN